MEKGGRRRATVSTASVIETVDGQGESDGAWWSKEYLFIKSKQQIILAAYEQKMGDFWLPSNVISTK